MILEDDGTVTSRLTYGINGAPPSWITDQIEVFYYDCTPGSEGAPTVYFQQTFDSVQAWSPEPEPSPAPLGSPSPARATR